MLAATRRCEDLPGVLKSQRKFAMPLMIVPGPKMPVHINTFLELIAKEFKDFGPLGELQNGRCCILFGVGVRRCTSVHL